MPVEQQLATLFEVIEGGAEVPAGQVIQFPTDMAGASATLEGTTTSVTLGNGVATEVSQLTVLEGGATQTAGVGLLAMDVGAVGLALAPALGILAGVGLYSLAPEFWTNVSNRLVEAGQTIGGKVRTFLNSETKQAGLSKETIEIFKEAFREAGLFNGSVEVTQEDFPTTYTPLSEITTSQFNVVGGQEYFVRSINANFPNVVPYASQIYTAIITRILTLGNPVSGALSFISMGIPNPRNTSAQVYASIGSNSPENGKITISSAVQTILNLSENQSRTNIGFYYEFTNRLRSGWEWLVEGICAWQPANSTYGTSSSKDFTLYYNYNTANSLAFPAYANLYDLALDYPPTALLFYNIGALLNPNAQEGATLPDANPFPNTYPTWTPWELPEGLPEVYPIEIPENNPNPSQSEAQDPDGATDSPEWLQWIIGNSTLPEPNPLPHPQPLPNPDPDPQPEPEPIPEPEPEPTDENPIDPNPDPTPSPIIPITPLPDTVPANAMFTVYAPTLTQVNSFGGWLWDSNILEQIKRIWQDPLNGIITFMKVYATPATGGSDTIKVGVLDSGVSSAVVTSQFVTIECGSINIAEKFYNATDYTPFVSLHLYLPFIGIVELDTDEFMNGTITVTYHVDVYTGTCLAEVKATRSPDMPNPTIVYTFSGNASQQLPLTSAEFSGALSSLVSAVGGGLAIASGGGLGLLAGASGLAHAVSHEMVHVAHSGSLSANAGIMGSRTPYLIITRHRPYDANGYNTVWGYPSNKAVYLNNCSGLVRVKDMRLTTGATRNENDEILELLKNGVII